MSVNDLLSRVISELERAGIPYMLTGSFASTFHGVPRTTHDIDIVIDPTRTSLKTLLDGLSEDIYYVSPAAAWDAFSSRRQFNIIDLTTGWKVDLIMRKARPFSVEEFRRRQAVELLGTTLYIATAEDTILAKLEWARKGESERQIRDVAGILSMCADTLDTDYIIRWARALKVQDLWERVRV